MTLHLPRFACVRLLLLALLIEALLAMGCAPALEPPPKDYEALLRYLFERTSAEGDEELASGIIALQDFMGNDDVRTRGDRGHSLAALPSEMVDALDEVERNADDLLGVGLITESAHPVWDVACTLTWENFGQIVQENFRSYERTFERDPSCFCDRSCARISARSETESTWAGVVELRSQYQIQFRRVPLGDGEALVHRFWLEEPTGKDDGITLQGNYYLGVTLPAAGTTLRVHANWFDVELGALSAAEDLVFSSTVDSMRNDAARIDTWIREQGAPRP